MPEPVEMPDGVVFESPGAWVAFRRDAVRRLRVAVYAAGSLALGITLLATGPRPVGAAVTAIAAVLAVAAGFAWARVRRLFRIASTGGWSVYTVVLTEGLAFLLDPDGAQRVLTVNRMPEWPKFQPLTMWMAGDPAGMGAVLTPAGGGELAWIRPQSPIVRRRRMWELLRRALPPQQWPQAVRAAATDGLDFGRPRLGVPPAGYYPAERELAESFDLLTLYDHGRVAEPGA